MEKTIYVKLLDEGTVVYRPVSAIEVEKGVFEIIEFDTYNSEDEVWEFLPGTCVLVEERNLSGEDVLVAVTAIGLR
jgi:hypothetical protein